MSPGPGAHHSLCHLDQEHTTRYVTWTRSTPLVMSPGPGTHHSLCNVDQEHTTRYVTWTRSTPLVMSPGPGAHHLGPGYITSGVFLVQVT